MLVGSVILGARVRINDLPRGLTIPLGVPITAAVVGAGGSTLPTGNYTLAMTFTNPFGETPSVLQTGVFTVGAAQGIQVTAPGLATLPGATGIKYYFGLNGVVNQWLPATTLPFTISAPGNPGIPPTRNTSFYPDVDGQRISAYTLYDWLNKAIEIATNICNGIPDMTALATVNNQTMYEVIGQWGKIDHGWWDGYQIDLAGRDDLFYRNLVPGVVRCGVLQQASNRYIIELQPQPNRSGGTTTLNGAISITASSIIINDVSGFKLPFGMAVIGVPTDPTKCEVVSFSTISGSTLGGVVRGMGGTVQQAWPDTTPLAEGNLRLSGLRSFIGPNFAPGDYLKTLPLPSGWSHPLEDFIVSRYRETEGNVNEAVRLMQGFEKAMKDILAGNKRTAGPRQVGPGNRGMDTVPGLGGIGGGILLP